MLHFDARINGVPIGIAVGIRRLDRRPRRDGPSRYAVEVHVGQGRRELSLQALVEHDYRDGALVLIRKSLQAVEATGLLPGRALPPESGEADE